MKIDLNADLGEGIGMDAQLMPYLGSCNIACGGHAGDAETIRNTVRLAMMNNVKIGAHPSFRDKENFGRMEMELPHDELTTIIIDQIQLVKNSVESEGGTLHHVKPHGALYNMAMVKKDIAMNIVRAMGKFPNIILYAPFNSMIATLARDEKLSVWYEAFADRNYNDDLTLVSRKDKNAVLHDADEIASHVARMVKDHEVKTINGNYVGIEANTVCIHGDNPNAVEIAKTLRSKLIDAGIEIS